MRERARVEFPSAFVTNDSTPRTREGLLINQIKSTRGAPTDAPHNATTNARARAAERSRPPCRASDVVARPRFRTG